MSGLYGDAMATGQPRPSVTLLRRETDTLDAWAERFAARYGLLTARCGDPGTDIPWEEVAGLVDDAVAGLRQQAQLLDRYAQLTEEVVVELRDLRLAVREVLAAGIAARYVEDAPGPARRALSLA